jgi:predicted transposase YbfD/YdcC
VDQPPSASIRDHFAALIDPRRDQTKQHHLLDIVTVALCAVICGAEGWTDVEAFGQAKLPWLRTFLALPNGIPSHDTFGRVFAALDPDQFQRCFRDWVRAVVTRTDGRLAVGQVVALDGKTLRRSHDRPNGKAAIHLVSAWATANRLVLGQVKVDDKSNEITALPALLRLLALEGCIVTIDAMGCQTAIAQAIVAQGADYVLALKGNQPALEQAVQAMFADAQARGFRGIAHDRHERTEKGHGRIEVRRCWTRRAGRGCAASR